MYSCLRAMPPGALLGLRAAAGACLAAALLLSGAVIVIGVRMLSSGNFKIDAWDPFDGGKPYMEHLDYYGPQSPGYLKALKQLDAFYSESIKLIRRLSHRRGLCLRRMNRLTVPALGSALCGAFFLAAIDLMEAMNA